MLTARRFPSRREWLAHRRIGGSDVAAILGLSSYRGPWSVYERLVEGVSDETDSPEAARGRMLEPRILRAYSTSTGTALRKLPPHTLFEREDWATASVDALSQDARVVVEAKSDRNPRRWGEQQTIERWEPAAAEIVRPDYYLQTTMYMWVLDVQLADLAVLVPTDDPFIHDLRVFRLHRDEEVVASMVAHLSAWWTRHVVGRVPPELDGSDEATRYLSRHNGSTRFGRPGTPTELALARTYAFAAAQERHWRDTKRLAGQHLIASSGEFHQLDFPGGHAARVSVTRTTLDEKALLKDHPDLRPVLDRYRRHTHTTYPRISGLETK